MGAVGGFAPLPIRLGGSVERRWASAAEHARMCADAAALVRRMPLAHLTYSTSGGAGTVLAYSGINGSGSAAAPTSLAVATGKTTWTWAKEYTDDWGDSYPFRIYRARVTGSSSTLPVAGTIVAAGGFNTITVQIYRLDSGAAYDGTVTLTVY